MLPAFYQITLSTIKTPTIVYGSNDTYFDIAFDAELINTATGISPPFFVESDLSDRIFKSASDLEVIIGDNLID